MSHRIHEYLDGELPRSALSAEEAREADRLAAAVRLTAEGLNGTEVPDLTARVMAELPREEAAAARPGVGVLAAWRWIWQPREIAIRPAYGLAAAAVLLVALVARSPEGSPAGAPGPASTMAGAVADPATAEVAAVTEGSGRADAIYVQFRFELQGPTQVALAGSFTGWEASYPLHEVTPGVWTAMIALEPGVHDYLFVVDGEQWVPDPVARTVDDGFGGRNSRLFLAPPVNAS